MKAIQSQFLDLLGANLIQFIIPVYQRIYSWDAKQCKDLWEDTMRRIVEEGTIVEARYI